MARVLACGNRDGAEARQCVSALMQRGSPSLERFSRARPAVWPALWRVRDFLIGSRVKDLFVLLPPSLSVGLSEDKRIRCPGGDLKG